LGCLHEKSAAFQCTGLVGELVANRRLDFLPDPTNAEFDVLSRIYYHLAASCHHRWQIAYERVFILPREGTRPILMMLVSLVG